MKIVMALAFLLVTSNVGTAQTAADKENLRGLAGVRLVVMFGHCPTRDITNCAQGLDEAQRPEVLKMLEDEMTAKLQNAGVPLLRSDELYKAGTPRLLVVVTMDKLNGFIPPLETEVKLLQRVRLARDTTIETEAVTWSLGGDGVWPKLEIPKIRRQVGNLVDRFIEDYLAVNPKQSATSSKNEKPKN